MPSSTTPSSSLSLAAMLAVVLALFASTAAALQFDLDVGRTKCLGEIMGKHEVAKGSYRIDGIPDGSANTGLSVTITGPANEKEYSQADASSGKFAFTANDAGAHKVCFVNNGHVSRRVVLDFLAGVDAKDYSDIAKKEHLQPLELELRKLEDRVDAIHKEMMYQREREETHRDTNESTNSRVVWFSLMTIGVVFTVSVFQAVHLYSFLKKKRVL